VVSQVFLGMVVVLLVDTVTSLNNFRRQKIFIPSV